MSNSHNDSNSKDEKDKSKTKYLRQIKDQFAGLIKSFIKSKTDNSTIGNKLSLRIIICILACGGFVITRDGLDCFIGWINFEIHNQSNQNSAFYLSSIIHNIPFIGGIISSGKNDENNSVLLSDIVNFIINNIGGLATIFAFSIEWVLATTSYMIGTSGKGFKENGKYIFPFTLCFLLSVFFSYTALVNGSISSSREQLIVKLWSGIFYDLENIFSESSGTQISAPMPDDAIQRVTTISKSISTMSNDIKSEVNSKKQNIKNDQPDANKSKNPKDTKKYTGTTPQSNGNANSKDRDNIISYYDKITKYMNEAALLSDEIIDLINNRYASLQSISKIDEQIKNNCEFLGIALGEKEDKRSETQQTSAGFVSVKFNTNIINKYRASCVPSNYHIIQNLQYDYMEKMKSNCNFETVYIHAKADNKPTESQNNPLKGIINNIIHPDKSPKSEKMLNIDFIHQELVSCANKLFDSYISQGGEKEKALKERIIEIKKKSREIIGYFNKSTDNSSRAVWVAGLNLTIFWISLSIALLSSSLPLGCAIASSRATKIKRGGELTADDFELLEAMIKSRVNKNSIKDQYGKLLNDLLSLKEVEGFSNNDQNKFAINDQFIKQYPEIIHFLVLKKLAKREVASIRDGTEIKKLDVYTISREALEWLAVQLTEIDIIDNYTKSMQNG